MFTKHIYLAAAVLGLGCASVHAGQCNRVPKRLEQQLPNGTWHPNRMAEWEDVGLLSWYPNSVSVSGTYFPLCFIGIEKAPGIPIAIEEDVSRDSDLLVFSIAQSKNEIPYPGAKFVGVSTFSSLRPDGTLKNWVDAYWCESLSELKAYSCRYVSVYECESGSCDEQ